MTALTQQSLNPKSMNPNHDTNQDTHSTADMILAENGSNFRQLTNAKIISATLIIITVLMGFILLTAIYIQSASRCICAYGGPGMYQQESQNAPYFEPLKSLSSEGGSKEMRNFPLRIHMNDPKNFLNGESNGRVSCEITRKTASQVVASEPKEVQTPDGKNVTTDPKLIHLTGEKLFFTCYNGEKPKPVVLIARPRIFAIFHRRPEIESNNSTETDDSSSGENTSAESNGKDEPTPSVAVGPTSASKEESNANGLGLVRNRRQVEAKQEQMECSCTCPIKKD